MSWFRSNIPGLLIVLTHGAISSAHAGVYRLVVQQDGAKVSEMRTDDDQGAVKGRSFTPVKNLNAIAVENGTSKLLVIEKPGFIPVYLPLPGPPKKEVALIQISLKRLDGTSRTQLGAPARELADELVDRLIIIQQLLDQKKRAEASSQASVLYQEHPQSYAVRMIYAQTLVANGQYAQADEIYRVVLSEIPEHLPSVKAAIQQIRAHLGGQRMQGGTARSPAGGSN
jgi:predicted Zn-dependent protease